MIAKYIFFSKVPVQGKCQTGNGTIKAIADGATGPGRGKKRSGQGFRLQIMNMQPSIFQNIGLIIKVPGRIERVKIDQADHKSEQQKYTYRVYTRALIFFFVHEFISHWPTIKEAERSPYQVLSGAELSSIYYIYFFKRFQIVPTVSAEANGFMQPFD